MSTISIPSLFPGKGKPGKAVAPRSSVPPSWLLLLTFTPELSDVVIETKKGTCGNPFCDRTAYFPRLDLGLYKLNTFLPEKFIKSTLSYQILAQCWRSLLPAALPPNNHHFQVSRICCFSPTPTPCCKQTETPRGQLPCLHKLGELWLLAQGCTTLHQQGIEPSTHAGFIFHWRWAGSGIYFPLHLAPYRFILSIIRQYFCWFASLSEETEEKKKKKKSQTNKFQSVINDLGLNDCAAWHPRGEQE